MRIAYLCADRGVPVAGTKGASVHVRAVAGALRNLNHDVEIVALRKAGGEADVAIEVTEPQVDPVLRRLRRGLAEARFETLASEVHGLLSNGPCLEALETAHRRMAFEAVYERYSLWSTAGLQFARRHRIPYVLEVNAPLRSEQERYRELTLDPVAGQIEKRLMTEADAIIVPSEEVSDYVVRIAGPGRRVTVVPNGADVSLFRPGDDAPPGGRKARRFSIIFAGSLKPWHGIPDLIEAFTDVLEAEPGSRLIIVGTGPLQSVAEEAASRLGPNSMTLTGAIPHEKVAGWLQQASVGVAPYPRIDEFYFSPLKVVEYMAAGLPVVASDLGQLRQLVEPERTGLLVEPGRPKKLAEALVRLARNDRLRQAMGRRARARAVGRHSWDSVGRRIERVLIRSQARYRSRSSNEALVGEP